MISGLEPKRSAPTDESQKLSAALTRTHKIAFALLAPFLLLLGGSTGSYCYLAREISAIQSEQQHEERENVLAYKPPRPSDTRLKKISNGIFRPSNQILELKQKQPFTVNLLIDLDQRWPTADPSWRISTLRTSPQGAIEIRGSTVAPDSVTRFVSALEFGGNFMAIQPEVRSTLLTNNSTLNLSTNKPVIEFSVKAIYAPLAGTTVLPRLPSAPIISSSHGITVLPSVPNSANPTTSTPAPLPLPGTVTQTQEKTRDSKYT